MQNDQTALPPVVSQAEWLVARQELLAKEKDFTRQRDALNAERRRLPMVKIEKAYLFAGSDGQVSLLDLFEGRRQLILYHFMFDPTWEEGCPSCSFVTDNIGHLAHLHARNTTLALVSRAPLPKLEQYKARMGWTVPWYSSYGSDFNYDFHVTLDPKIAPVVYNYQRLDQAPPDSTEGHGLSVFLCEGDSIYHTYSTYARGCEPIVGTYTYLDFTPLGRQEDWEQPPGRSDSGPMSWLRRHDQYGERSRHTVELSA
jgi:predicted dithiol-disulfide oxidoreductase (DUF899 family)